MGVSMVSICEGTHRPMCVSEFGIWWADFTHSAGLGDGDVRLAAPR